MSAILREDRIICVNTVIVIYKVFDSFSDDIMYFDDVLA